VLFDGQNCSSSFGSSLPANCPGGRIVAITNEQTETPEFADTFVYGVEGPEALIEAIRQRETSVGA